MISFARYEAWPMLITYRCRTFFDGFPVLEINSVRIILRCLPRNVSVADDINRYCLDDIFPNSLEPPSLVNVRCAQNCAVGGELPKPHYPLLFRERSTHIWLTARSSFRDCNSDISILTAALLVLAPSHLMIKKRKRPFDNRSSIYNF